MWAILVGLYSVSRLSGVMQFSVFFPTSSFSDLIFSNYEETCLSFYYMTKYSIPQVLKPLFLVVWWNALGVTHIPGP